MEQPEVKFYKIASRRHVKLNELLKEAFGENKAKKGNRKSKQE